jgi:hypothetical protein
MFLRSCFPVSLALHPRPGKTVEVCSHGRTTGALRSLGPDDEVLDEVALESSEESTFLHTVLEAGTSLPRRFRWEFTKAVETEAGTTNVLPYQGRAFLFERVNGRYELTADEGPALPPEVVAFLTYKANAQGAEPALFPPKPSRLGEPWPIDTQVLADGMAPATVIDPGRSRASGKLLKVWDRDGAPWGLVEVTMALAVTEGDGLSFSPPLTLETRGTLESAIDGSTAVASSVWNTTVAGRTSQVCDGTPVPVEVGVCMFHSARQSDR